MICTHVLQVPATNNPNIWFQFINNSRKLVNQVEKVLIDFNRVNFLDTDDFVVLACLIEEFHINNCEVLFRGGTEQLNRHLDNIKFKEYWKSGFNRTVFTPSRNKSTLCLWKISSEMTFTYSQYAREYFESLTNDKDLVSFGSNLDEVFNNIFDHSQSKVTGYIITQYYPKNNTLSFAVCDFGIGIPTSIRNSKIDNTEMMEDFQLIRKSLDLGVSAKSTPRNRGFGLNNILTFTDERNGTLNIISNAGVVVKTSRKDFEMGKSNYYFNGTLVKVKVDLTTFEEKDNEMEDFTF